MICRQLLKIFLDRVKKCKAEEACQITPDDLVELVGANSGLVNCYPGIPNNVCCRDAYFISLTSGQYLAQRGRHLSFRKTLELFVQHMQGHCKTTTKVAILIFDSWDQDAFMEWESAVGHMQDSLLKMSASDIIKIKFFLISGRNLTPISIPSGEIEFS